jgi:hypothetical protein
MTRRNFRINPSLQTVSYAVGGSINTTPVLSLRWNPLKLFQYSYGVVENLPGKKDQLHQSEVGFIEESYVEVI